MVPIGQHKSGAANTLLRSFDSDLIGRVPLESIQFRIGQEIEFHVSSLDLSFSGGRDGIPFAHQGLDLWPVQRGRF